MTLELSAPLRVTWDLPADAQMARSVWARLVEARALFAEILLPDDCTEVLEGLLTEMAASPAMKVTLIGPSELIDFAAKKVDSSWLQRVDAVLMPPYPGKGAARQLVETFGETALGLWSTPEGMEDFERAVCLAGEIASGQGQRVTVSVLNPSAPAVALNEEQRNRALEVWNSLGGTDGVTLRIHDLFLSEALGLDPFASYGGCAAASVLAHVTREGRLVACRTFPSLIGNLLETPLQELWAGPLRKAIQTQVSRGPVSCKGCALADTCLGGCPGLQGNDGRDTSCKEPRKSGS